MAHRATPIISQCLANLPISIHHKRSLPGDRFINRLAAQNQCGHVVHAFEVNDLPRTVDLHLSNATVGSKSLYSVVVVPSNSSSSDSVSARHAPFQPNPLDPPPYLLRPHVLALSGRRADASRAGWR